MSVYHKCDRCGRFYKPYKLQSPEGDGTYSVRMLSTRKDGQKEAVLGYELCYECACDFLCFLREGHLPENERHYRSVTARAEREAGRQAKIASEMNDGIIDITPEQAVTHDDKHNMPSWFGVNHNENHDNVTQRAVDHHVSSTHSGTNREQADSLYDSPVQASDPLSLNELYELLGEE